MKHSFGLKEILKHSCGGFDPRQKICKVRKTYAEKNRNKNKLDFPVQKISTIILL